MIGYLRGKVIAARPTEALLDVNGVGYIVHIPVPTFEKINGSIEATLFIYTHVREDALQLFGFSSEAEKEMFILLLGVNGIGPKSALSILSGIRVNELKNAIERGDLSRIVVIPGIGRKTAERLVLELKGRVEGVGGDAGAEARTPRSEAIAALGTLGYNAKVAEKAVRDVLDVTPGIALEGLIKAALKRLNE